MIGSLLAWIYDHYLWIAGITLGLAIVLQIMDHWIDSDLNLFLVIPIMVMDILLLASIARQRIDHRREVESQRMEDIL